MTVRLRLTLLYSALFGACAALLLGLSYWLLGRHLHRTLPDDLAREALSEVGFQYLLAFAGTLLVAVAGGWALAGRVLSPLVRMTRTARAVSEERLDERIALAGPRDELRELADTLDAMLDRLAGSFDGQRRFIANASHELRSPLTVIRAEAEVALADPDADVEELRRMGQVVVEATRRTEALLEGLLILARSQRGLARRDDVDLAAAARAAEALAGPEAQRCGVRVDLHAGPARTVGDRALIERLIANLLENGVRHNRRGGFVEARTFEAGGRAVVRVENSGPRVDPAVVERLTEPFERQGRGGDRRGAGLGLSIVRSVAEAHGGRVELRARPDGGLAVEAELPRRARSAGGARTGSPQPA